MLPVLVQGLGRIDAQLGSAAFPLLAAGASRQDIFDHGEALTDHLTLSYLWVLGTYELVRTLGERAREDHLFDAATRQNLSNLKARFARLRMPLAKLQPAHAHAGTDAAFAWPVFDDFEGAAWRVAPEVVISRKALAEELLEFLEGLSEPT